MFLNEICFSLHRQNSPTCIESLYFSWQYSYLHWFTTNLYILYQHIVEFTIKDIKGVSYLKRILVSSGMTRHFKEKMLCLSLTCFRVWALQMVRKAASWQTKNLSKCWGPWEGRNSFKFVGVVSEIWCREFIGTGSLTFGEQMIEAVKTKIQSPYENLQTGVNPVAFVAAQNCMDLNYKANCVH